MVLAIRYRPAVLACGCLGDGMQGYAVRELERWGGTHRVEVSNEHVHVCHHLQPTIRTNVNTTSPPPSKI